MSVRDDYENHPEIKLKKALCEFRMGLNQLCRDAGLPAQMVAHLLITSGSALVFRYLPNQEAVETFIQHAINDAQKIHSDLKDSNLDRFA